MTEPMREWRTLLLRYGAAGLLAVLLTVPALVGIARDCRHNFDLGIYAQALHHLRLSDLNPYLSTRDIRVFNDHFDPILLAAAPFAKLLDPAWVCAAADIAFVLAAPLPILWLYRRKRISAETAALIAALVLLNRGTIRALSFPAHPTTWAVFPVALLGAAVLAGRPAMILGSLTFLFFFREEFAFAGLAMGVYYVATRRYRLGAAAALMSAAWIALAFAVRPAVLGPVMPYGPGVLGKLWRDPAAAFAPYLSDLDLARRLAELAVLLVPLAIFLWRRGIRPHGALAAALLPMLLLRFIGNAWYAHYMAPVMTCAILALTPARPEVKPPRWVLVAVVTMLLAFNGGGFAHLARVRSVGGARCPASPARLDAIAESREWLLRNPDGAVLAEGNLIPRLVRRPDVYQVGGPGVPEAGRFRYIFVEKPPGGDPYPLAPADYETMIAAWRSEPGARILRDDEWVFLAEGRFTRAAEPGRGAATRHR